MLLLVWILRRAATDRERHLLARVRYIKMRFFDTFSYNSGTSKYRVWISWHMHFWLKIGTNWACCWSWSSLIFVFHLLHTLSVTNILQPSWEKDNLGRVWVSWRCSSWNLLFNWNVFEELTEESFEKNACSLGLSWNCSAISNHTCWRPKFKGGELRCW